MDTEDNDAMNVDDTWKGIISEGDHLLTQESGKGSKSPKEGGQYRMEGRTMIRYVPKNILCLGVEGKQKKKRAFKGGRYNEILLQKNKE